MNGIIIVNQELGHNEYKIKRFTEEFNKLGVTLDVFVNDGSLAIIKDNNLQLNLPKCDFVIYLDKDIYLARMIEKQGIRMFDSADFIKLCDDKGLTNISLANKGILMPKTISGPLFYSQELKEDNFKFLDYVVEELGLPLVLKKVYGSLGTGVFLVKSKDELINLYKEHCRNPLQFQEYIKTSDGRSMRILIIDEQIVGGFERYNREDFRSNFSTTASAKTLVITDKIRKVSEYIAKLYHIEYAGLDFLFGENDEPVLCEMNSNAFFEEFEKVTKINVAEIYAKMVIRKIYEQK